MIIINKQYSIIAVTHAVTELTGWERAELVGKKLQEFVSLEGLPFSQNLFEDGPVIECTAFFKNKNRSEISMLCSICLLWPEKNVAITFQSPTFPAQGEPYSFSIKYFFESNFMGVVLANLQNRILDANDAFLNMLGYTREDFQSGRLGWRELVVPEYMPAVENALRAIQKHKEYLPFELQFIRKDGQFLDVLVGGGQGDTEDKILSFAIDISQKKQVERELIAGEALFRNLSDSSASLIFFLMPDFRLRYLNKAAQEMFGVPVQAWENFDWSKYIHPDDLAKTHRLLEQSFRSKERYVNELRLRRHDGVYRMIYSTGNPVIDENGELIGYVGTGLDISELREAQEKLASYARKLEESNKELEHFATIASHDLQEPLRKVRIFSDHLTEITRGTLNKEAFEDLKRIQNASDRMQRLIGDLLDLSRINRRGQTFQKVDLRTLTEEAIAELRYTFQSIHSRVELTGSMIIDADSNQMRQLIAQLLDNGLKFHKPGQPSKIKVDIHPWEEQQCRILISDNGIGIKPQHVDKIFDTFVRLHHGTEYPGTGIGLTLVKKIVERHHGSITVESTPGEGSTFVITLPLNNYDEGI